MLHCSRTSHNSMNYARTVLIPISPGQSFSGVSNISFFLELWFFFVVIVMFPFSLWVLFPTSGLLVNKFFEPSPSNSILDGILQLKASINRMPELLMIIAEFILIKLATSTILHGDWRWQDTPSFCDMIYFMHQRGEILVHRVVMKPTFGFLKP